MYQNFEALKKQVPQKRNCKDDDWYYTKSQPSKIFKTQVELYIYYFLSVNKIVYLPIFPAICGPKNAPAIPPMANIATANGHRKESKDLTSLKCSSKI